MPESTGQWIMFWWFVFLGVAFVVCVVAAVIDRPRANDQHELGGDTCCDDWWANLPASRKKWVHWYFRDIHDQPDFSHNYAVADHQEALKD